MSSAVPVKTVPTVLVTGAGKRLGRAIALGLAAAGWRVFAANAALWAVILAVKGVFDYFVIIRPLVEPVRAARLRCAALRTGRPPEGERFAVF